MVFIVLLAFSLLLQGALGGLVCEQLPSELCAYSISSTGKRCILENFSSKEGAIKYQCKTSEVAVDIMKEWIETDACVDACGVDRNTVGISSDSLLQAHFLEKLCSNACYFNCPNIVDLYHNLAIAEGSYLPKICTNPRRALYETRSSGEAAPGPVFDQMLASSPGQALSMADAAEAPLADVADPSAAWAPSPF